MLWIVIEGKNLSWWIWVSLRLPKDWIHRKWELKKKVMKIWCICGKCWSALALRSVDGHLPHGHLRTTRLDTKRKEKVTPVNSSPNSISCQFCPKFFFVFFPIPIYPSHLSWAHNTFSSLSLKKNKLTFYFLLAKSVCLRMRELGLKNHQDFKESSCILMQSIIDEMKFSY